MARNMRRFYEIFHVAGDPLEYYYALRDEMPEPLTGIIGYVLNDSNDDVHLAIEVDDVFMEQRKADRPVLYVDPDNYLKESRIVITHQMVKRLQNQEPDTLFHLWHEVGHFQTLEYYLQDYMNYEMNREAGYTAEQYMAIIDGQVMEYDAAADDFAVNYCPVEYAIIAMNGMIAKEKSGTCGPANRGLIQNCLNRKKRFNAMREHGDSV